METKTAIPLSKKTEEHSLQTVLQHNEKRYNQFIMLPFFEMIANLYEPEKRIKFLNCLQVFANYFQNILICRQATCFDAKYADVFLQHLTEELGHNKLLEDRDGKQLIKDPILEAISSWFCYQMFILDNHEKAAIVHLVLESSGDYFTNLANPVIGKDVRSGFFEIHAKADPHHTQMGVDLLKELSSAQYKRLIIILDDAWSMMSELTHRFKYLTENYFFKN